MKLFFTVQIFLLFDLYSDLELYYSDHEIENIAHVILDGEVIKKEIREVGKLRVENAENILMFSEVYTFEILRVLAGDFKKGDVLFLSQRTSNHHTDKSLKIKKGSKFRYFGDLRPNGFVVDPFFSIYEKNENLVLPLTKNFARSHLYEGFIEAKVDAGIQPSKLMPIDENTKKDELSHDVNKNIDVKFVRKEGRVYILWVLSVFAFGAFIFFLLKRLSRLKM